jgi:serine/threonine protein kinase/Flp pilus assembly protein TadD
MIGTTISHYRIIEKLGSGGMGVVYKAEDLKLHRTVALKFLPPELTRDEEAKKRFKHEAEAASSLEHNNICNIHEIGESNEQMFIVMSCYEGETLKCKIEKGPIDLKESLNIIIQIAEGLARAHDKGIIHRDIKPANIFITNDGTVKIFDFGLAKASGQTKLTQLGAIVGTAAYMSPEQVQGINIDKRADIWSLGVVFYEMLTGEMPFKGIYEQAVIFSVLNEEPEFVSKIRRNIPRQVEDVINKALQKNPERRFNNVNEITAALQPVLEEFKTGTTSRFSRRLGRKQRKLVYKAALFLAAFIAVIIYLWYSYFNQDLKIVSIALLPLQNISQGTDQEWFSDGMTDALITDLAKISGLRVISRSSVMKFKGTGKSASEIARELDVNYIVEGSVIRIAEKIKISTRLIDVSKDRYLWAQDYEREFKNILSLQSEVAQTIAGQIQVQVTPFEQKLLTVSHQVNPDAYESYLKGNFYWYKLSPEALDLAMQYYTLSAKQDSQYALAYAGMVFVWIGRAQSGYESVETSYDNAKALAKKALELDSTLAEVHKMLAGIKAWWEWDWKEAEKEFKNTIRLNPNSADAKAPYAHLLYLLERPEEGRLQIEKALELDPLNILFKGFYGMTLMYERRYDVAIDFLEKTRLNAPQDPIILSTLRSAYHQKGLYKKALEIWRKSFELHQDHEAIKILNQGYSKGGYSAALRNVAELMISRSEKKYVTPWQIATLYTRAGMENEALSYFEKAFEVHDPNMPYLKIDPVFDNLRNDVRYKALIKKMGL